MRRTQYRGHQVELTSEQTSAGGWVARATIVIDDGKAFRKIPIFGRRRTTFDTQRKADSYALELAKLWIDGRLWGGNGCG
ncbi:MAG TPA: hypothetical protein VGA09_06845 [Candidatus Binatia bacterium]